VKIPIQLDSMNAELQNSIWNVVSYLIPPEDIYESKVVTQIATDVLRVPRERVGVDPRYWLLDICQKNLAWARWYDLLEYVVANAREFSIGRVTREQAEESANRILEREHSGYRFVGGELSPITAPIEIAEIESALAKSASSGLGGTQAHIERALVHLGSRPKPDYRNAIKEAISAVESAAQVIAGKDKATLDDALKAVAQASSIHGAMVEAFRKLYGYTSEEKGIRHALLEETAKVDAEDARFMIVACSAFVNLLILKADKAGLLKSK
jgi:hypothetical protein